MTINSIIDGISIALDSEFNEEGTQQYTIRANELKQGLKEPCFFISCINPAFRLFFDKRYFRENEFCIQYFPQSRNRAKEECNAVAERLFLALEYITVDGDLTMGTKMYSEFADGILNFFVNYDSFVYIKKSDDSLMETLTVDVAAKGQVKTYGSEKNS